MNILVTGAAGFIGSKLTLELVKDKSNYVIAIDNINDYYDITLKHNRLRQLLNINKNEFKDGAKYYSNVFDNLTFIKMDITMKEYIDKLFSDYHFDVVVNLAAQAGVRYSITHPYEYINSNIIGFMNIIECCRNYSIQHLIYASSSSVYGLNSETPFNEEDKTDRPVSLYAATKKSNELIAHSYCKLYGIPCTGLRFFTVYGPYGRPDMAPALFAEQFGKHGKIKVFNNGNMYRDFTYIDDIVNGVIKVIYNKPKLNKDGLKYNVYNIGHGEPVNLKDFIKEMENNFGYEIDKEYLPMQDGDVYITYASTNKLFNDFNYIPKTSLKDGIKNYINWYKQYYKIEE